MSLVFANCLRPPHFIVCTFQIDSLTQSSLFPECFVLSLHPDPVLIHTPTHIDPAIIIYF